MGFLDNTTVTVDAILTNKGREILAKGGQLSITKFALADDEVDYSLWNPAHSLGTNYYGAVIENMPILEAVPDETQMMRYKLVTLPKNVIGIPVISVAPASVSFTNLNQSITITADTLNLQGANSTLGYTAILSDDTVCSLQPAVDSLLAGSVTTATATRGNDASEEASRMQRSLVSRTTSNTIQSATTDVNSFLDDETGDITTSGRTITKVSRGKFVLKPKGIIGTKSTLLTIIGNETGGFKTVVITVTDTINENTTSIQTDLGLGS